MENMEWFALIIPLIAIPCIKHYFPHKILWWECIIPLVPALILIPLISSCSVMMLTRDTERFGGWVTEARYYEDWDEWITKTCTRQVRSGRDSKGNATYRTETYDCSYREYHPEYWEVHGSNGEKFNITRAQYGDLINKFQNETFVDLHRHYYHDDGDMYKTTWPQTDDSFAVLFTEHSYKNKVQASKSVFSYPEISPEDAKKLYEYPKLNNNFYDPAILGSANNSAAADKKLQYLNARFGRSMQIRYWVLIFRNQPRNVGFEQESFWKGGNKNEFVVCVNLDGDKPTWCHTFCWSPDGYTGNDVAKIEVRNYIEQQKSLDMLKAVDFIHKTTQEHWKRKSFSEFDYLTVSTPFWVVITIYFITLAVTAGASFYVIKNEHENSLERAFYKFRKSRYN